MVGCGAGALAMETAGLGEMDGAGESEAEWPQDSTGEGNRTGFGAWAGLRDGAGETEREGIKRFLPHPA